MIVDNLLEGRTAEVLESMPCRVYVRPDTGSDGGQELKEKGKGDSRRQRCRTHGGCQQLVVPATVRCQQSRRSTRSRQCDALGVSHVDMCDNPNFSQGR